MWITRAFFLKIVFERHFFDPKKSKSQSENCFFLNSTSKIFLSRFVLTEKLFLRKTFQNLFSN
jgi:hypothetical protein